MSNQALRISKLGFQAEYAHYLLSFRSEGGAATNAEQWFDEELKQT